MLIENPEALKIWLTRTLEPICDADPAALAKYVMALVKKDKAEKELREICMDQLDVFLQKDTKSFVDTLFATLKNKNYIIQPERPSVLNQQVLTATQLSNLKPEVKKAKVEILNSIEEKEDERSDTRRSSNRRTRSHSRSPPVLSRSRSRSSSRSRDRDDRRRRYTEEERRRREFDHRNRRHESRHEERSYRSRDRDRSRENDRARSRDKEREGIRNTDNKNRSRPDSQVSIEAKTASPVRNVPSVQDHGDTDYRVGQPISPVTTISPATTVALSSTISVVNQNSTADSTYNSQNSFSTTTPPRKRCRDYDEKGFCMRGDLCPFDHGADPVIVEDVNLPNVLGFTPQANPPSLPAARPPLPPMGQTSMPRPPPPRQPAPPPPPPPPPPPMPPEPYMPEPYNPEAPSMNMPPRVPYWIGPRTPAPKPIPSYHQPRARELRGVPIDDSSNHNETLEAHPGSSHQSGPHQGNSHPIGLHPGSLHPDNAHPGSSQINSRIVIDTRKHLSENIAPIQTPYPQYHTFQPHNNLNQPKKPRFDYNNQGGGHFRKQFAIDNSTLEIRKVPRQLNNIAKLNEHFSKFGHIVNLQVCFEGDPEAALVQFTSHLEANSAYRSSEAVFNNRFIKVFWHNKNKQENQNQPQIQVNNQINTVVANVSKKPSVKDRLGGPLHKMNHVNNTPEITPSEEPVQKTVVYTTSGGISKTVYNLSALKTSKTNKPTVVASVTAGQKMLAIRKKQEVQRKEVMQLKTDLRKRHQDLLEKQIHQQKLLIEKLEKNKNMSTEDKTSIMKNLLNLSENIEKYKKELKTGPDHQSPKSSHEAQKEILDAELEIINKQNMGADTTELRRRVSELKQEASALGLLDSGRGRGRGRARGRPRFIRGIGRAVLRGRPRRRLSSSIAIDRRTRQVKVKGFSEEEKDDLLLHFVQYGEVENIAHENHAAVITFKKRSVAEVAAVRGAKFKGKPLIMEWYKPPVNVESTEEGHMAEEEGETVEDEASEIVDEDLLLADEEEEEEDSEARSWRR